MPPRFTSCTCPKSSSAYTYSRKLLSKEVQDASSRRSCLRAETRCQGVWSVKTFKRCAGHCLISFLLFTLRLLLQRVIFVLSTVLFELALHLTLHMCPALHRINHTNAFECILDGALVFELWLALLRCSVSCLLSLCLWRHCDACYLVNIP